MSQSESLRRLGDAGEQHDMFGEAEPQAYVPDPRHVRNRLTSLLAQLKTADAWPWEPVMVRLHRDRNIPYLIGLLQDRKEAERWRKEFAAEMERLEAKEAA